MTDTTTHDPITGEVMEENTTIEAASDQGQMVESIITPKMLLPPGWERDPSLDPRNQIAMQPLGSVIMLGSLAGTILKVERHENEYPPGSGTMLKSVWLLGEFEAVNYGSGQKIQAGVAVLPNSYGNMIATAYDAAVARGDQIVGADLDCEIGVKSAVRGAVKFQWVCQNYVESPTARRVRELRNKQDARLARRRMTAISDQSKANAESNRVGLIEGGGDPRVASGQVPNAARSRR